VEYEISDELGRVDRELVYRYLAFESYWAKGRSREVFERSLVNSLCLGAYDAGGALVGFARVVTDDATFAWLCDLFVVPEHRGKGVASALVRAVREHPRLSTVFRIMLATKDAHELYRRHGYRPMDASLFMELRPVDKS
jgi:GNAT superfamily N-acetyltransferase